MNDIYYQILADNKEPFISYVKKYSAEWCIRRFLERKTHKFEWSLIPAEQYQQLLERYMTDPIMARIPDNVVSNWLSTIFRNTAILLSLSRLKGNIGPFPFDDILAVYPKLPSNRDVVKRYRYRQGLFRWVGYETFTDVGVQRLYEVIKEYRDDMTPEEKLILVNRLLDVTHYRGTMVKWFLEGGKETAERISQQKNL